MVERGDVSIDYIPVPREIRVDSPSTEITMQDLHDTLRVQEARLHNMSYDALNDSAGKVGLDLEKETAITLTLLNALIGFQERPGPSFIPCEVKDGVLAGKDVVGAVVPNPILTTTFVQVNYAKAREAVALKQEALIEIARIMGLDINNPLTVTQTSRVAGAIRQTIGGDGRLLTTVTRDP